MSVVLNFLQRVYAGYVDAISAVTPASDAARVSAESHRTYDDDGRDAHDRILLVPWWF